MCERVRSPSRLSSRWASDLPRLPIRRSRPSEIDQRRGSSLCRWSSKPVRDCTNHLPGRNELIAGLSGAIGIGIAGVDASQIENVTDAERKVPVFAGRSKFQVRIPLLVPRDMIQRAIVEDPVFEA